MSLARETVAGWGSRQWLTAAASAVAYTLAVSIPTDVIDTPLFSREIPPTWWAWPSLVATSALVGLLVGTYVTSKESSNGTGRQGVQRSAASREQRGVGGYAGAFLTFFAVGCPVCNKVALLALGYSGAITWFEPFQPVMQVAGIALLGWALHQRLSASQSCPVPTNA